MPLEWECPSCDRIFHTDTRLGIEGFGPWNYCPSCGHRRGEDSAEEIAEEYGELVEFGHALRNFEEAARSLRRNGHATVNALEGAQSAQENLEIVFSEYDTQRRLKASE